MKKYLLTFSLVFFLSINLLGQIDFKRVSSQLSSKKTRFETVQIGDVTNDGLNDIIVGSGYYFDVLNDYNVFVYKQNPNGTLADPIKIGAPQEFPGLSDIEIADMNNDKLNDIVVAYGSSLAILYQLPSGGFSKSKVLTGIVSSYGIKVGDLNNDGLKDIFGYDNSSNFKIFYQNSSGEFLLTSFPSKTWYCTQVELGDVNGDNLVDMIKMYDSEIEILYQKNGSDITKDSTFIIDTHQRSTYFSGIALGDVNKDGKNDIIAAYGGNTGRLNIYYQKQNGQPDTANVKTVSTYDCPTPVRIADLNCDGDNEIIIGHSGWNSISVYDKHDKNEYSTYALFPAMYYFNLSSMAVGDINNDQRQDVVTVGQEAKLDVFYNNSKPLVFDSITYKVVNLQMKRDTTDLQTVKYIAIVDTASQCKKNRSIRQLITETYANENYSADSLSIRYGKLCSNIIDTVKTSFTYKKSMLLKTIITESIVNFDTLTTAITDLYFGSSKYSQSINLNSNICWNVSVDADWAKPEVYSGVGNKDLGFVIDQNLKASSRTAKITISGDSVPPLIISVYQYAAEPFVSSQTSIIVLSEKVNNMAYIEINSNTSWSISKSVEWLSFNKTEGTDNDIITIQGAENETSADRIGSIAFSSYGSVLKRVSVLQLKKAPNGIENLSDSEFKIYPNPVRDKLIVASDLPTDKTQIQIYDLNGIVRWSGNMIGLKSEIDLSWLQQGIYLVKIKSNTKNHVQTIVKQ